MALPPSEMALLQRSTSICTSRKTKKQVLKELALQQKQLRTGTMSQNRTKSLEVDGGEGDDSVLIGTAWGKKRRRRRSRRKLKVEKVVLDPRQPSVDESGSSERESDDSSGEEDDRDSDSKARHTRVCCNTSVCTGFGPGSPPVVVQDLILCIENKGREPGRFWSHVSWTWFCELVLGVICACPYDHALVIEHVRVYAGNPSINSKPCPRNIISVQSSTILVL